MLNQEIQEWIDTHNAHNLPANEVARQMILEAINNTTWAEDCYPNIKDDLIKIVSEYEIK